MFLLAQQVAPRPLAASAHSACIDCESIRDNHHPNAILQDLLTSLALTEAIYRVLTEGRDAAAMHFEGLQKDLQCAPPAGAPRPAIWWSSDDDGQR